MRLTVYYSGFRKRARRATMERRTNIAIHMRLNIRIINPHNRINPGRQVLPEQPKHEERRADEPRAPRELRHEEQEEECGCYEAYDGE